MQERARHGLKILPRLAGRLFSPAFEGSNRLIFVAWIVV
jgi:hypothetical protein